MDEEITEQVQQATNDWGLLSQVTGNILKREKYSVYFMSYKYVCEQARLKTLKDLPSLTGNVALKDGSMAPSHITILQPDGSLLPVQTHDVSDLSNMLLLFFCANWRWLQSFGSHARKGFDWVDNIHIRPLHIRDC